MMRLMKLLVVRVIFFESLIVGSKIELRRRETSLRHGRKCGLKDTTS